MGFRVLDVSQNDVSDPWVIGHEDLGCDEQGRLGSLTKNGKESIAWRRVDDNVLKGLKGAAKVQGPRVSKRQRRGVRSQVVEARGLPVRADSGLMCQIGRHAEGVQ